MIQFRRWTPPGLAAELSDLFVNGAPDSIMFNTRSLDRVTMGRKVWAGQRRLLLSVSTVGATPACLEKARPVTVLDDTAPTQVREDADNFKSLEGNSELDSDALLTGLPAMWSDDAVPADASEEILGAQADAHYSKPLIRLA